MPRANRRGRQRPTSVAGRQPMTVSYAGGRWFVRPLSGATSDRGYRCPGCDQTIPPATAHVVVWPADGVGGVDHRRHWHSACWQHRERRRPLGPIR